MNTIKKNIPLILLLAFYEMAIYLSDDAYLPAVPQIVQELNTTYSVMQLALTTWFIGSALVNLLLGPISDRVGRRPVLLWGGLVFIAATAGCSLTHNIYLLLLLRLIQGATVPSMIVASYATIHDLFNREQAIHTSAIMGSIAILAPAFGPLAGATILYFANWRWIFGILSIWAAVMITGLFFKMPETKNILQKQRLKKSIAQYQRIILNKKFMLFNTSIVCLIAGMIAWITAAPFLVIAYFHLSTFTFGIMQAMVFGSYMIGTHAVKLLMKWFKLEIIIWVGLGLSLIGGFYAFIAGLLAPHFLWRTIIALMLLSAGTGLTFPILNRLAIESSDEPMSARVAMTFWLISISGVLGSALISSIYNLKLFSFGLILFLLTLLAILAHLFNKTDKTQPCEETQ